MIRCMSLSSFPLGRILISSKPKPPPRSPIPKPIAKLFVLKCVKDISCQKSRESLKCRIIYAIRIKPKRVKMLRWKRDLLFNEFILGQFKYSQAPFDIKIKVMVVKLKAIFAV